MTRHSEPGADVPEERRSSAEESIHGGDEATVADTVRSDTAVPEEQQRPGIPSRHQSKIMIIPLIAALLFYFGPAAGFLAGDRATKLENRELTDFPSLSQGWMFIPQFQLWANDYLPLRGEAIAVGTKIAENVFNEPPNYGQNSGTGVGVGGAGGAPPTDSDAEVNYPKVIEGKDGWLFFGGDVTNPCQPTFGVDKVISNLQRINDAVVKSGRTFVVAVAPDKTTIMPEFLPEEFAGQKCMEDKKAEFWKATDGLQDVDLVDPRASLKEIAKTWGEAPYRKTDTHWAPRGALDFAEMLAEQLDPGLLESTTFDSPGTTQSQGDLSVLLGAPSQDTYKQVDLNRTGVTMSADGKPIANDAVPNLTYQYHTVVASSTGAKVYAGKTLLLGDSFFAASRNMVAPFFASLTYIHNQTFEVPGATQSVINTMVDSDTVVYEIVERSLVSGASAILQDDVVAAIEKELAANPKK